MSADEVIQAEAPPPVENGNHCNGDAKTSDEDEGCSVTKAVNGGGDSSPAVDGLVIEEIDDDSQPASTSNGESANGKRPANGNDCSNGASPDASAEPAVKRSKVDDDVEEVVLDDDESGESPPVLEDATVEPKDAVESPAADESNTKDGKSEKSDATEKKTEETKKEGKKEKEPELTSSEALLDKLEGYVSEALDKGDNVERKILDALLAAINIQVQREPLSVRKLILDKQLVLPNTISFPPSQTVDLLIEHDPEFPLQKVIQKMFPDERPKLSEAEKKERHIFKTNFGAPHMTKMLMEIGQDLVQESTYSDIVHAKNLPEIPKNVETYKQVAAQLRPVWETLKKKNESYKLKSISCHICGFKTESRIVMLRHRSTPHHDGKKFQCTMCPEFDTNESRMNTHYVEVHSVVPCKDEPPLRNPCYICDEDFPLKGAREAHFKVCKKDYHRMRYIMSPKSPEDLLTLNRWLWEKPPVDPTILAQQQVAQQQQQKQQRAAQLAASGTGRGISPASNRTGTGMQHNLIQQQMLSQQRQAAARSLLQQQQNNMAAQLAQAARSGGNSNSLIAAMQQHLAKQMNNGRNAGASLNSQNVANVMQAALKYTQQQQQQATTPQAIKQQQEAARQRIALQAAQQQALMKQKQDAAARAAASRTNSSTTSTPTQNGASGTIQCEICDQAMADRERYLAHLQATHKQMKGKSSTDMGQGAPLACSRCRDRFWTYEGLERHLVMSHGLVTSDLLQKAQKKEDGGRCKLCGKQYAFNMLQHLVADHQVKLCSAEIMYSCDVCAFKCQSYQKLENHLSTVHPKNAPKPAAAAGPAECITLDD